MKKIYKVLFSEKKEAKQQQYIWYIYVVEYIYSVVTR